MIPRPSWTERHADAHVCRRHAAFDTVGARDTAAGDDDAVMLVRVVLTVVTSLSICVCSLRVSSMALGIEGVVAAAAAD